MKRYWSKLASVVFWQDKIVVANILVILFLTVSGWLLVAQFERFEGFVPWHYTVYFGIDRVGPWWRVVQYPTFGSLVALINFFLAVGFYHQRRLFAYLIFIITIFIELLVLLQILGLLWFLF